MTERIFITIFCMCISLLVGVLGYWLKTAHNDFKGLIGHLTSYTTQLKEIIIGIQMQIEKGIESDIIELKTEVKKIGDQINQNRSQISALNQKSKA